MTIEKQQIKVEYLKRLNLAKKKKNKDRNKSDHKDTITIIQYRFLKIE